MSQITNGVALPTSDTRNSGHKEPRNTSYVLLRRYRGLKTSGYAITTKTTCYDPYRLTITFREQPEGMSISAQEMTPVSNTKLLVISAIPVKSIYKGSSNLYLNLIVGKFTKLLICFS